jgi:hypothetical protein
MKLKKLPNEILVGQRLIRLIGNEAEMPMIVTEVTDDLVICTTWCFDRKTGAEIDPELGWGPGGTGSYLYDLASSTSIAIVDTRVSTGGAMRCCLHSIGEDFSDTEYAELGQEHVCPYCKEVMKLEIDNGEPTWKVILEPYKAHDKPDKQTTDPDAVQDRP